MKNSQVSSGCLLFVRASPLVPTHHTLVPQVTHHPGEACLYLRAACFFASACFAASGFSQSQGTRARPVLRKYPTLRYGHKFPPFLYLKIREAGRGQEQTEGFTNGGEIPPERLKFRSLVQAGQIDWEQLIHYE